MALMSKRQEEPDEESAAPGTPERAAGIDAAISRPEVLAEERAVEEAEAQERAVLQLKHELRLMPGARCPP